VEGGEGRGGRVNGAEALPRTPLSLAALFAERTSPTGVNPARSLSSFITRLPVRPPAPVTRGLHTSASQLNVSLLSDT
jgi:hypothetical protein